MSNGSDSSNKASAKQSNNKRFSASSSKTFKAITLSTLLIILPFAFYWYVQISDHQTYEQEKIYRTLRELELHISKELQALQMLVKVIPTKDSLLSSETPQKQTSNLTLSACGLKLIERSALSKYVKPSDFVNINCEKLNSKQIAILQSVYREIDTDTPEEQLFYIKEFESYEIDAIFDVEAELAEPLQSLLDAARLACQNDQNESSPSDKNICEFKNDLVGIMEAINTEGADGVDRQSDIAAILELAVGPYRECKFTPFTSLSSTDSERQKSVCDEYVEAFEYFVEDTLEPDSLGFLETEELTKVVEETAQILRTFFKTSSELSQFLSAKVTELSPETATQGQVESRGGQKSSAYKKSISDAQINVLVSNNNILKPYKMLLSETRVCMFVSASSLKYAKSTALIDKQQLLSVLAKDDQRHCDRVLEGKSVIVYRTNWSDENRSLENSPDAIAATETSGRTVDAVGDNAWTADQLSAGQMSADKAQPDKMQSEHLWLAIGVDTILKRYRNKLTYLEDIYLTDSDGSILASFIGATKEKTTETLDNRIVSLKPVILKAFPTDSSGKASEKESVAVIRNTEIGIDKSLVSTQGEHVKIPSWAFQTRLNVEGIAYQAMVKPMSASIPKIQNLMPFNSELEKPLILIGLQRAGALNILTDRLSPLFHLTVLFVALLLLFTMPVFHVKLARKYNSYTQFTAKLYRLALILMVVVSVIGVSSYFTMLKENMFSAELLVDSADSLIDNWIKERNAGIQYLENADRCLFDSAIKDDNARFEQSCSPDFSKLSRYRGYRETGPLDSVQNVDSYIYKPKNAVPMIGMIFATDADGNKQTPDWMARDFVPISNKNINLSKRQYFSAHKNSQAWKAQDTSRDYYIERIFNYVDGRKVTQLSIPRTNWKEVASKTFNGVVAGEIMALSLENPILPPGMQFAVIESKTGKVLFHSEKETVLVEDFYSEIDENEDFEQAVKFNSPAMEMIVYRSKKVFAYAKKIPESDWSLVMIYDFSPVHSMVNEVAIGVIFVILAILFFVSILIALLCEISRFIRQKYHYQDNSVKRQGAHFRYIMWRLIDFITGSLGLSERQYLAIVMSIALIFSILYNFLNTETGFLFIAVYLFVHLVICRKTRIKTLENVKDTGSWIRTRPMVLSLFLVIWVGLPSIFLFIRWFDISAYQIQAYNFLEIKNNLLKRDRYVDSYKKTLWYRNTDQVSSHWLNKNQQRLAVLIDLHDEQNDLSVDYKEYHREYLPESNSDLPLKMLEEPTNPHATVTNYCLVHGHEHQRENSANEENHDGVEDEHHPSQVVDNDSIHKKMRSIPPLGKLSRLAYSIDGQHCEHMPGGLRINVAKSELSSVWGWKLSKKILNLGLHRITRLAQSENLLIFLSAILFFILYVYARTLVNGIWNRLWTEDTALRENKRNDQKIVPRHRIFVDPDLSFANQLYLAGECDTGMMGDFTGVSKHTNIANRMTIKLNAAPIKHIDVYLNLDLAAMENDQRKSLLQELEGKLHSTESIIWITAELPPLYRLLSLRADLSDYNLLEISSSEILRWANLFARFYKDYHANNSEYLKSLLQSPILSAFDPQKVPQIARYETHAFYPELCWVGNVINEHSGDNLNGEKVTKLMAKYADAYYRLKWEECTLDEKLVLFQVASDRFPSTKNSEVIGHLLRRGYIVTDPFLKICNESFKRFIINAEDQATFDEWTSKAEQSGWQQMRIYFGVLILLILAWLAYTSKDTYQQLAYIVGSLLTVFTALTQGASMLKLGKGSDGDG